MEKIKLALFGAMLGAGIAAALGLIVWSFVLLPFDIEGPGSGSAFDRTAQEFCEKRGHETWGWSQGFVCFNADDRIIHYREPKVPEHG